MDDEPRFKKVSMSDLHETGRNSGQGLCSSCRRASNCTYPRMPARPILECEEFDGILAPLVHPGNVPPVNPVNQVDIRGSDFKEFRGLCSNCEHRTTCTYPRPEGGVWHCEEYE